MQVVLYIQDFIRLKKTVELLKENQKVTQQR
jgi:hypothetical protein